MILLAIIFLYQAWVNLVLNEFTKFNLDALAKKFGSKKFKESLFNPKEKRSILLREGIIMIFFDTILPLLK